jgi:glycosidase
MLLIMICMSVVLLPVAVAGVPQLAQPVTETGIIYVEPLNTRAEIPWEEPFTGYAENPQLAQPVTETEIERVEPPNWWAGMEYPSLQLLVKGDNIGGSMVSLSYPGVTLYSVTYPPSPDYLFIDLLIDESARPGTFTVTLSKSNVVVAEFDYSLLQREEGSAMRRGFDNSDVMYLVMPDRFANGDTSNDEVEGMKEGLNRKRDYGRHGGDIKGITDNLDYISSMGFTAVWLNPVLENDQSDWSYHGYAATDFYRVDRRFGTNEEYRDMALIARSKGVKLIMDMIFNHCGSSHWWMENPPFPDWINNYPDYKITSHRRTVNMDPYASKYDIAAMTDGWFVPSMPDLNQRNPFMANYLIQNSIWWIEYAHLAGIRMDTYPYPDKEMMAEWNRRILLEYPAFTIVGEEWSLNPALVSYWQKDQNNRDEYNGMITSMMDFPLQDAVARGLTEKETFSTGMVTIYEMLANDFLYPDPGKLVIFPDNHDMPRFYMQVGMDNDLFRLGITLFLTTRGIPQIFYGTEILMTHKEGNDHGVIRKDFPGGWPGDRINGFTGEGLTTEQMEMQRYIKTLLNYRKKSEVLHTGTLTHFAPENGVYVYFRTSSSDTLMVILNKGEKEILLPAERFSEITGECKWARNIISGEEMKWGDSLKVPARRPLVLELK